MRKAATSLEPGSGYPIWGFCEREGVVGEYQEGRKGGFGEYPPKGPSAHPPRYTANAEADDGAIFLHSDDYEHRRDRAAQARASNLVGLAKRVAPFVVVASMIAGAGAWLMKPSSAKPERVVERPQALGAELPASFDSVNSVALCDENMRLLVKSPSSYRSEWGRRIQERDGVVAIRRKFTAQNAMGVDLSSEYTCLVGASTNKIIGIQYDDAGRTVTVPGDQLRE